MHVHACVKIILSSAAQLEVLRKQLNWVKQHCSLLCIIHLYCFQTSVKQESSPKLPSQIQKCLIGKGNMAVQLGYIPVSHLCITNLLNFLKIEDTFFSHSTSGTRYTTKVQTNVVVCCLWWGMCRPALQCSTFPEAWTQIVFDKWKAWERTVKLLLQGLMLVGVFLGLWGLLLQHGWRSSAPCVEAVLECTACWVLYLLAALPFFWKASMQFNTAHL